MSFDHSSYDATLRAPERALPSNLAEAAAKEQLMKLATRADVMNSGLAAQVRAELNAGFLMRSVCRNAHIPLFGSRLKFGVQVEAWAVAALILSPPTAGASMLRKFLVYRARLSAASSILQNDTALAIL